MSRFRSGLGKGLYLNTDNSKICGVCSGLADYFNLETWIVRILAISFLLFSGGTAALAYFVASFILEPKPGSKTRRCNQQENREQDQSFQDENAKYKASVKDVWKRSSSPSSALQQAELKFEKIENKLQNMEGYVTSKKYQLDKEFDKL